jgi:hypothetical protein
LLLVFGAFVNAAGMVDPVMMWEEGWRVGAFVLGGAVVLPLAVFWLGGKHARRLAFALVPLGVSMWAAHLAYHALGAVIWLQLLLLDAGLLLTLYTAWRMSQGVRLKVFAPWASVACLLFAAGAWIFFQPMQMRGMMP